MTETRTDLRCLGVYVPAARALLGEWRAITCAEINTSSHTVQYSIKLW